MQVSGYKELQTLSWHLSPYDTETALETLLEDLVHNKTLKRLKLWIKNPSREQFETFTYKLEAFSHLINLQLDFGTFSSLDNTLISSLSTSIAQLINLRDLKIMYNKTSSASSLTSLGLNLLLSGIESLPNLQGLFLSLRGHSNFINDDAAKILGSALSKLEKLQRLVLKLVANNIMEIGVLSISSSFKKLKRLELLELDLSRNGTISDDGMLRFLDNLGDLESLSSLDFMLVGQDVQVDKVGLGIIGMITRLKRLNELSFHPDAMKKYQQWINIFSGKIEIIHEKNRYLAQF